MQFARGHQDMSRIVWQEPPGGRHNVDAATHRQIERAATAHRRTSASSCRNSTSAVGQNLLLTAGIRADQSSLNADPGKLFWFPEAATSVPVRQRHPLLDGGSELRAAYGESRQRANTAARFSRRCTPRLHVGGLPGLVVRGTTGAADLRPERQREIEGGLDQCWGTARESGSTALSEECQ